MAPQTADNLCSKCRHTLKSVLTFSMSDGGGPPWRVLISLPFPNELTCIICQHMWTGLTDCPWYTNRETEEIIESMAMTAVSFQDGWGSLNVEWTSSNSPSENLISEFIFVLQEVHRMCFFTFSH
jgi:hypothetical protein